MQLRNLKRPALHLFTVSASLLIIGCGETKHDSTWWEGENDRITLENQLRLKKFRYDQAYSDDFDQLTTLKRSNEDAAAALASLRSRKQELTTAVAALEKECDQLRRSTLLQQRQAANGKVFDELALASGRKYQAVSVSSIDDGGVTIRHEHGSAKLRYEDLTTDQRLFFGLEEDLAAAAEDKEAENALAYERWLDNRMVAIREEKRQESVTARRTEIAAEKKRTFSAAAARDLVAANTSPLAQPARTFARSSRSYSSRRYYSYHYRAYRYCTPVYRAYCAPRPSFIRPNFSQGRP